MPSSSVLKNPRFVRLWFSYAFSGAGTITLLMAQALLALELTDSAFWVGAIAGVSGLGILTFSLISGMMADRIDRRVLVGVSAVLDLIVAVVIALLVFFSSEMLWHLLLGSFVSGVSISLRSPATNALTLDLVGRSQLIKATAANFAAVQFVNIIAPISVGLIISRYDFSWAYVMAGVTATMALISIASLRGVSAPEGNNRAPVRELIQGVRYVFTAPTVRSLILLAIVAELFGWSHETILPVMTESVLKVGPSGLGYILSVGGAGAVVMTVLFASFREVGRKGIVVLVGLGSFGTFLILFALSPWLPLSLVLIAVAYSAATAYEIMLSALLQLLVPNNMRGRVLSFQTATWGIAGLAGFLMGAIAAVLGAPIAIAAGGGIVLLVVLRMASSLWRIDQQAIKQRPKV